MKILKFLTFFLLAVSLSSCSKDDTTNPCESISCSNGGMCINGVCDCPDGFTGPDCGSQMTPNSIKINSINLRSFPATEENGAGWDLFDGADIYIKVSYNEEVIYQHPTFYTNANSGQIYSFIPTTNLNIHNPTDKYVISLWDKDDLDDDFMGGIIFTPYFSTNGFPATIILDAGSGISFDLSVAYIF